MRLSLLHQVNEEAGLDALPSFRAGQHQICRPLMGQYDQMGRLLMGVEVNIDIYGKKYPPHYEIGCFDIETGIGGRAMLNLSVFYLRQGGEGLILIRTPEDLRVRWRQFIDGVEEWNRRGLDWAIVAKGILNNAAANEILNAALPASKFYRWALHAPSIGAAGAMRVEVI
jgi:hypothetical protein